MWESKICPPCMAVLSYFWPHFHKKDNFPGAICKVPHHESPGESFVVVV